MAKKRAAGKGPKAAKGKSKAAAADDTGTDVPQAQLNLPKSRDLKHWYLTLKGSMAKVGEASSFHSSQVKKAKEAGVDTAALIATIRWEKKDDLDVRSHFAQLSAIFKEVGMPVQFRLFDAKYEDAVAQAKVEGYRVGEAGRSAECRWPEGSPEAEAFMAAWVEGQTVLVNKGQGGEAAN